MLWVSTLADAVGWQIHVGRRVWRFRGSQHSRLGTARQAFLGFTAEVSRD